MKLVAKVRLIHEKNAEHMIRAFFNEFDPRSSILIKGETAELEIYFKELPKEIIDSITHCGIMEFICAPHLCQDEEDEQEEISEKPGTEEAVEETTTEPEPEEAVEETTIEPELEETQEVASTTLEHEGEEVQSSESSKKGKRKKCEVPELAEFAAKSESYEAFVNNVATWLNLGKNHQFFVKVAQNLTLPSYGKLHWIDCKFAVGKEEYSDAKKISCTAKVAAKFKGSENEVTILKLLEAIIEYREFDFHKEMTRTTESAEETLAMENSEKESFDAEKSAITEETAESVAETTTAEESPVEPNLVAENPVEETTIMSDVLCFKEAVESVDKTLPIEARVMHVLTAMGVEKLEEKEQENVLEIANVAVTEHDMDLYYILSKTNIPQADALSARMTFATFINNVVKEYAPSKQIKLEDFLKELQKGVMLETEIEGITD